MLNIPISPQWSSPLPGPQSFFSATASRWTRPIRGPRIRRDHPAFGARSGSPFSAQPIEASGGNGIDPAMSADPVDSPPVVICTLPRAFVSLRTFAVRDCREPCRTSEQPLADPRTPSRVWAAARPVPAPSPSSPRFYLFPIPNTTAIAHRTSMTRSTPRLHQGDCIQLPDGGEDGQLYQVIGVDDRGDRCWLRAWPLARHGSPVFEVSLRQLQTAAHRRPHSASCRS